jgi:hypothetical protein
LIIFLKNSRLNSEEVRIIVIHFSQSTFFDNIFSACPILITMQDHMRGHR